MAAFTTVTEEQLQNYLILFECGELVSFEATARGIENSNFFLTLEKGEYVLTIFETLEFAEVPFFNNLAVHLNQYGLPVSAPERTLDGMNYTIFRGKPAVLVNRLPGEHISEVSSDHCRQVGTALAELHEATLSFRQQRPDPYDEAWLQTALTHPQCKSQNPSLLATAADVYRQFLKASSELPGGVIHGDLFVDNTLFDQDQLTGLLDFYHACNDCFILDLAITLNDWAFSDGVLQPELAEALINAYQSERELTSAEKEIWPMACQAAALRFWLTRIETADDDGQFLKDPHEFEVRFSWHQQHTGAL